MRFPLPPHWFAWLSCWLVVLVFISEILSASDPELQISQSDFFERYVRPALIEHCQECHSSDTEASGGLLLDSRAGWEAGGDSGTAIVPGKSNESRLLIAIGYGDPHLQMPPDGKLSQEVYDVFAKWIDDGAFDPRESNEPIAASPGGLTVERAQEHWAYRPIQEVTLPAPGARQTTSPIDWLIDHRLVEAGITPAPRADRDVLMRRLAFDLTGLPPDDTEPVQSNEGVDFDITEYERQVDRLLASPRFAETFARNWMDVARYAESITLRGFVLPEAWRYRDYLVQAFAEDRPFNQMIREQIAGDLLESSTLAQRQMQHIATTFLAMGNTNLEEQDKSQLEMDYVDEQLDLIGRAFLGQTIGCARCHDHKFDPIPTRDYYALAGIFKSAIALKHDNVSRWIDQPLPLSAKDESYFDKMTTELTAIKLRLSSIKQETDGKQDEEKRRVSLRSLAGTVVDSDSAKLVGAWTKSHFVGYYVGDGYIHDDNQGKGEKTATFSAAGLSPGRYQVRLAYTASTNRASNVKVHVFSADGEATVFINQRQKPAEDNLWISLGDYRFEKDGQSFVLITNDQSDGHVIVDAVQFLPLDQQIATATPIATAPLNLGDEPVPGSFSDPGTELKSLESRRKEIESALNARPRYLAIVEQTSPVNLPIHIRGDVHNLGSIVPRGFLTAVSVDPIPPISESSSGRKELADWLVADRNPLTARVYANRVWYWLMGQGLVTSIDNFGTTGNPPTHPELLDWLAGELIRNQWSTKHLVRQIVRSEAYRRRVVSADSTQLLRDPNNLLYWRGHSRRLNAESIRDAMLCVSGEMDSAMMGSTIRSGTSDDFNYSHTSFRRSLYHPVFRNSLPPLFEAFDFADPSVSVGQRARSTVATQSLVLLNHPWVAARAKAAAERLEAEFGDGDIQHIVHEVYRRCLYRSPTEQERESCVQYLTPYQPGKEQRFQMLVQSLFASIDFRYLE